MFQASEFVGLMFDWYAVDKDGHIASFVSGWGLIPVAVFSDEDAYNSTIKFFEGRTGMTVASVFDQWQKRASKNKLDTCPAWAAREAGKGLFAYDEYRDGPIHFLCAKPEAPVSIDQLPEDLAQYLSRIRSHRILFRNTRRLDITKYYECDFRRASTWDRVWSLLDWYKP